MRKSVIKNSPSGQALVEFVLCAAVLAVALTGALGLGSFGLKSIDAQIQARNRALAGQGARDGENFRRYVLESAELTRFVNNYEATANPSGLPLDRVTAQVKTRQHGRQYTAVVAVDLGHPAHGQPFRWTGEMEATLAEDLFGPAFQLSPFTLAPDADPLDHFPHR